MHDMKDAYSLWTGPLTADAQNEFGVCRSLAVFCLVACDLFLQASSREAAPYYCNYDLYTFH